MSFLDKAVKTAKSAGGAFIDYSVRDNEYQQRKKENTLKNHSNKDSAQLKEIYDNSTSRGEQEAIIEIMKSRK